MAHAFGTDPSGAQEKLDDMKHYMKAYLSWKYPQAAASDRLYTIESDVTSWCVGKPDDLLSTAITGIVENHAQ